MARIPDSELERLKREVSLERLVESRGVELERKGKDLHGRCPFHEDRTPSLVISPEKNLWNCLGACQEGGDVIQWVMRAEGVSFRHAVELLRADLPLSGGGAAGAPPPKHSTTQKLPPLVGASVADQKLLGEVVGYYHQTLKESPEALGYLQGRGLSHPELVETFRLGYADRTLGYRLPARNRKEGAELRGRLQALGVYRKSGHEHLAGSLVVPISDVDGRLVQMYGRKIRSNLRKGTALHLYLPGPQRGVFNLDAVLASKEVILTESIFDALTFWVHGFRNVTCTYGAKGLHRDLREALKEAGTDRVLIAFDRDTAGDKAAERVARDLTTEGMDVYRVLFPRGMDANEYARKVTPARKSLELVVRHAPWVGESLSLEQYGDPRRRGAKEPTPWEELPEEGAGSPSEAGLEEAAEEGGGSRAPDLPAAAASSSSPSAPPSAEAVAHEEARPTVEATPPPAPPGEAAPLPEPPARRVPAPPVPDVLERRGEDLFLVLGERTYRVRGLHRNTSIEVMKVNLRVSRPVPVGPAGGSGVHVDSLDLYVARQRQVFAKQAAAELGLEEVVVKHDLGRLLLLLEEAQEEALRSDLEPETPEDPMSEAEREEAMKLLRDPDLLEKILTDFRVCGVVGEETNKLVGYLAAVSRKLEKPLAIVVQSNSAAGKSSLMDAVLAFVPPEEVVSYSAMTGQSLFYMGGEDLRHKILAIAEEEGAQRASYALKLLQSEGQLTIASTGKDPTTGRLTTEDYRVEGPVMIFLTTTASDVDEELLNRCLVLTVDEGPEQTEAIHRAQRRTHTLTGKRMRDAREGILRQHRNAQRLLEPLVVHNPYAEDLTFQRHQTRFRRDHKKYLDLIDTLALLHQHQREQKTTVLGSGEVRYIEVEPRDIAVANRLAREILGRSTDELPPQTRGFLRQLSAMVAARCLELGVTREDYRFTRREVREWTGMGNNRVHVHLKRLEELEYVLIHPGRRGRSLVYELCYQEPPGGGDQHFPGLLDVGSPPSCGYDAEDSGAEGEDSGSGSEDSGGEAQLSPPIRTGFAPDSSPIRGAPSSQAPPETRSPSTSSSSLAAETPASSRNARRGSRPGGRVAGERVVPADTAPRPGRGNGARPPAEPPPPSAAPAE